MYYQKLKDKITFKVNTSVMNMDTRFDKAMSRLEKEFASYREKAILEDVESIEVNAHIYPGDRYITANVYDTKGDGFQFIIEHETDSQVKHKPGEITG